MSPLGRKVFGSWTLLDPPRIFASYPPPRSSPTSDRGRLRSSLTRLLQPRTSASTTAVRCGTRQPTFSVVALWDVCFVRILLCDVIVGSAGVGCFGQS